jgi:hypothetical protein
MICLHLTLYNLKYGKYKMAKICWRLNQEGCDGRDTYYEWDDDDDDDATIIS